MNKPPLLIGIAGLKRSGKDTLAKHMQQRWERYSGVAPVIASFADPLRAMLAPLLTDLGVRQPYSFMDSDDKDSRILPVVDCTFRKLIQTLGTEWGRGQIDSDMLVKLLLHRARFAEVVIVPDVRFPNEARLIRCHGVLIHLKRPATGGDGHISESGVEFQDGDYVIENGGGLKALMDQADQFVMTVGNDRLWV